MISSSDRNDLTTSYFQNELVIPFVHGETALNEASYQSLWHLLGDRAGGARLDGAWQHSTGSGVLIGIVDEGVNRGHADLTEAYASGLDYDPRDQSDAMNASPDSSNNIHGTWVAGLIAGSMSNSVAGAGAAPGARITGAYLRYGSDFDASELAGIIRSQVQVDVSNNSWGFTGAFADNFANATFADAAQALADVAATGRGGLGTSLVFAAGNAKLMKDGISVGDDTNFHSFASSRHVITVGAHDEDGNASFFSTPGATVLLTAPGVSLATTDGTSDGATGSIHVSGTSFAAPLVSSTIALMLAENPSLGWRDVQEILVLSSASRTTGQASANGSNLYNGGGLLFDREGGFGRLDAEAAVNLARNWTDQSTSRNEESLSLDFQPVMQPSKDVAVFEAEMIAGDGNGFSIDHVELAVDLYDRGLKDLSVSLISPEGTRIALTESMKLVGARTTLTFTFGSVAFWGENAYGTWTVELAHAKAPQTFMAFGLDLKVYGDADTPDDIHYITDSFADLVAVDATRAVVADSDGGNDTLNFAAARSEVRIDLVSQSENSHAGVALTLDGTIENVIGSTADDDISGDAGSNRLLGEGGDDILNGRDGDDALTGGDGADIISGGHGSDLIDGGDGADVVVLDGSFRDYTITQAEGVYTLTRQDGSLDTIRNVETFSFADVVVDVETQSEALLSSAGPQILSVSRPVGESAIPGGAAPQTCVAVVTVTDANVALGDVLSFALLSEDGGAYEGPFSIVSAGATTANIVVSRMLGNVSAAYDFVVVVTDLFGNTDSAKTSLVVDDINEAPEIISLDNVTVLETASGEIVGTLTAVDPNDDDVVYSLDDGRFEMIEAEGKVILKLKDGLALDYEAAETGVISLSITASDGRDPALTTTETFAIIVENVDEGAAGQSVQTVAPIEVGSTQAPLGLVPLIDPEGDPVTYTVSVLPSVGTVFLAGTALALGADLTGAELAALTYSLPDTASGSFTLQFIANDGSNDTPLTVNISSKAAESRTYTGDDLVNRIDGAAGNDTLQGLGGNDTLLGGSGNDTLLGGAGADMMTGGTGDDAFVVDNVGDVTSEAAGQGSDLVYATVSYTLAAGQEIERLATTSQAGTTAINLTGNALGQQINGNAGANTLNGQAGADAMYGFGGNDIFVVDNAGDTTFDAAGQGSDTVIAGLSYTLATGQEIERLATTSQAGTAAINLTGNALGQQLNGNAGANTLNGLGGADAMYGYGGNDIFVVDNAGDTIFESAGRGSDLVYTSVSYTLAAGQEIERLVTTSQAGTTAINLTGNALGQQLNGNAGVNTLNGLGGADTLFGFGGNDRLTGGAGLDFLTGGTGNDIFIFTAINDSGTTSASADRILDFGSDKIDLSAIDANMLTAANDAFALDVDASFSTGEIRQTLVGNDLFLTFNTDSDADAEMSILVVNHGLVSSGDFVF